MKSWIGIDAKVHEAILYLQDYAAAVKNWQGNDFGNLAQAINTVLTSFKQQQELNKRLNEENVALMRKKEA